MKKKKEDNTYVDSNKDNITDIDNNKDNNIHHFSLN